jgi:hypothetical protein
LICAAAQLNAQRVITLDFASVAAINLIAPTATNRINVTVTHCCCDLRCTDSDSAFPAAIRGVTVTP